MMKADTPSRLRRTVGEVGYPSSRRRLHAVVERQAQTPTPVGWLADPEGFLGIKWVE
jgi:hypothetical protein